MSARINLREHHSVRLVALLYINTMAERDAKFQFRIKVQSTKFQTEFISEHKFSVYIHFRAQNFCQDHAALLNRYLIVHNFGREQASETRLMSSMDKSGMAS